MELTCANLLDFLNLGLACFVELTKERLTTKQSGNKKCFSNERSLIHTTDAFLKRIDDKKLTACVLLGMSKAFDSIDHQILSRKIQSVGASTSTLKWFNSYLTNRYQVLRIHSSVSDPLLVEVAFLKAVF